MVKRCPFCARFFAPRRSNQKFCSDRCRLYAHYGTLKVPTKRTCLVCEKVFTSAKSNQKYCCITCHDIANNKKQAHKKVCAFCRLDFWTTTDKRKYCSKECTASAKALRDKGRPR